MGIVLNGILGLLRVDIASNLSGWVDRTNEQMNERDGADWYARNKKI